MDSAKNSPPLEISVSSGLVKPVTSGSADDRLHKSVGILKHGSSRNLPNGISEGCISARRSESLDSESVISEDGDTDSHTETNSPALTYSQKQDLFDAISEGDVERVEELIDQPGMRLDVTWYRQNMLVTAIRAGHQHMAEFLVDIGVDCNYAAKIFDHNGKSVDCYMVTCRQMAYDNGMTDLVDLIDYKNGHIKIPERLKTRKPRTLKLDTKKRLSREPQLSASCSGTASVRTDDSFDENNSCDDGSVTPSDDLQHDHDPTLEYVTKYMRAQQTLRSTYHDEGYISTSPKSSTRGSPVSPNNGYQNVAKHLECFEDAAKLRKFSPCSSFGSYPQESRMWATARSNNGSRTAVGIDRDNEETTRTQVRTQSPWRDDKQLHPRRQRRLPATPTSAVTHRPRIMSPPSQATPRSSRMLLQAKIVTLPNKLAFSALPNPCMSPREHAKRVPSVPAKCRQIPYGKNNKPTLSLSVTESSLVCNKYDEHFVANNDSTRNKKSSKTSANSTKV